MENASKALLMAAEVLIAMMIVSLGVYVFYTYSQTSREIHDKKAEQQLVEFNAKYTKYVDQTTLTIYDVRTIANYAKKDNENLVDSEKIEVMFEESNVVNKTETEWDAQIQSQVVAISNGNTELRKYKCIEPEYTENGRVKKIKITNP